MTLSLLLAGCAAPAAEVAAPTPATAPPSAPTTPSPDIVAPSPKVVANPEDDDDQDGLSNQEESWWLTDPQNAHTAGLAATDAELLAQGRPPFLKSALDEATDRDGDQIPDDAEIMVVGTDPRSPDSDGDGYRDGIEFWGFDLDDPANVQRTPGGPLKADLPRLVFRLSSPKVTLASEVIVSSDRRSSRETQEDVQTFSGSTKVTTTTAGASIEATEQASFGTGGLDASVSVSARQHVGIEYEATQTTSFTAKSTFLGVSSQEWAQVETANLGESTLRVDLYVSNAGSDTRQISIDVVDVKFFLGNDQTSFAGTKTSGAIVVPAAGKETSESIEVKMGTANFKRFAAGEPIRATVSAPVFTNDEVADRVETARTRTVNVIVDRGATDGATAEMRIYDVRVSSLVGANPTIGDVLRATGLSIEIAGDALVSFDDRAVSTTTTAPFKTWTVALFRGAGASASAIDIVGAAPLETPIAYGDRLILRYDIDADGDGLPSRLEHAFGSSEAKTDTDGDGISDAIEVFGYEVAGVPGRVRTSPASPDTDGDGLTDSHEKETSKTSGVLVDTDADGIWDKAEVDDGSDPRQKDVFPPGKFYIRGSDASGASLNYLKLESGRMVNATGKAEATVFEFRRPDSTETWPQMKYRDSFHLVAGTDCLYPWAQFTSPKAVFAAANASACTTIQLVDPADPKTPSVHTSMKMPGHFAIHQGGRWISMEMETGKPRSQWYGPAGFVPGISTFVLEAR